MIKISFKRKEFFPILFTIKKYGIIWYKIGRCCNIDYYVPRFLMVLLFAFKKEFRWRCDQCGKKHSSQLIYHTVPVHDKKIQKENKMLDEVNIWQNP